MSSRNQRLKFTLMLNKNIAKGASFKMFNFAPRSRKAKILTAGILDVFRGLEFESDAEIGQKGTF